ncbi:c-type cytochrome [Celeribacter halophilus]|uniref:Cytochrome C oxidase, cbb3-type, subunit III n=1 Tax=Celeribacter halophilus TaxID=576117 RepID=A0A1I3WKL6_9RHOB|nr:cytochrome c [Celeribacter halophilus]PZX06095.1 cbb3-type cytochrome c oxidase subunit III [Celeribacter halophilus]SFK07407.1 Cytochrome C oxidase, cbb3-type, subunit III [Celeribacter halophilus]
MRHLTTLTGAAAITTALLVLPVSAETPEELFEIHCAACHNTGGIGNPGLAPPLNRPAFWQALGDTAPEYLAGVVVSGMTGKLDVQDQMYIGLIMPPVASTTDEELVEIGNWVLQTLGETDGAMTQARLDATREARPSHADLRAMRPSVD